MIVEALAAAVLAATAPGAPAAQDVQPQEVRGASSVAPVVIPPLAPNTPPAASVNVPSDDTVQGGVWASVWPQDAYRGRIRGHVILTCDIDRYGIAERCQVTAEKPPSKGCGAAALELRPTFKLKPAAGPDGPINSVVNIVVDFNPPDPSMDFGSARAGGPLKGDVTFFRQPIGERRSISMLDNPVWASSVSYADFVRAYPPQAGGVEGYAVAHCQVSRKGTLSGCQIIKEDPDKHGFGQAALALAARFRVTPNSANAPGHPQQLWVDIPFRFAPPGGAQSRSLASPQWVAGFDPDQAQKVFPPEAAAKDVATGHGLASCVAGPDGTLADCQPMEADPAGLGFSEAAAKLASTLRVNPWTLDGAPVDGAVVQVGVRLNLRQP